MMDTMERLRALTNLIEESTEGRQRLIPSAYGGGVDIQTDNDAYTGLLIRKKLDYDTGDITLGFQAAIRRMGGWLSGQEFRFAAEEIREMDNLLCELEQSRITVTQEEMREWSVWLSDRQVDRATQLAHEREPQPDEPTLTMGMP